MTNPFNDFMAVDDLTRKLEMVDRLAAALEQANHSEAALAQLSGVPIHSIRAMQARQLAGIPLAEVERVLSVVLPGGN